MKKKIKKDNFNRSLIITCILIIVGFIAVLGVSFAFFQSRIDGNKKTRLKAAIFNVTLDDGSEFIKMNNAGPQQDQEGLLNTPYTFTINNNNSVPTINDISFSDTTSTIPNTYIKCSIKIGNSSWSNPKTLAQLDGIIDENRIIGANSSLTYSIVMWLSSGTPNDYMDASYQSKVTIETRQASSEEVETYS